MRQSSFFLTGPRRCRRGRSTELGITEERVRRIETRARDEYRKIAEAQKVDLLAF
jgi:hypothetical protein